MFLLLPRVAVSPSESILGRVVVVGVCGCLAVLLAFALDAWVCFFAGRRRDVQSVSEAGKDAAAAIVLYPTRNDFSRPAAESLIGADGVLVVLDDSTLPEACEAVDAWAAGMPGVRVLRRAGHYGYKAGNLNAGLREMLRERLEGDRDEFRYFSVSDADGIFPPEALARCRALLEANPGAALVQMRQEGYGSSPFTNVMAEAVGLHFRYRVRARAADGWVMFYGHGAVIRREAWEATGGFPEIVTEDLSWTMLARAGQRQAVDATRDGGSARNDGPQAEGEERNRRCWTGIYADDLVCLEEFPATYGQLRKRTEKWIRGTAECLWLYGRGFFGSKRVPLGEKLDVAAHGAGHFMALPMLVFLALLAFVLPREIPEFRFPGGWSDPVPGQAWWERFFVSPVPWGKSAYARALGLRAYVFWSWDFYVIMLLTVAAPFAGAIHDFWKRPRLLFRYASASTFLTLSGLVAETGALFAWMITGKAVFRATNDAADNQPATGWKARFCAGYHANHPLVFLAEAATGLAFLWAAWRGNSLWFFSPGIALLLSPAVAWLGWDNRMLRLLIPLPFLLTLGLLGLIGLQLCGLWR